MPQVGDWAVLPVAAENLVRLAGNSLEPRKPQAMRLVETAGRLPGILALRNGNGPCAALAQPLAAAGALQNPSSQQCGPLAFVFSHGLDPFPTSCRAAAGDHQQGSARKSNVHVRGNRFPGVSCWFDLEEAAGTGGSNAANGDCRYVVDRRRSPLELTGGPSGEEQLAEAILSLGLFFGGVIATAAGVLLGHFVVRE